MSYVIYESKQAAIARELELTASGIKSNFFPEGEKYDIGGLVIFHPTEDKAAIEIYKFCGMVTPLSQDDLLPCNYEPLFTEDEQARKMEVLTPDWFYITP
jgi:hypothetical protein